MADRDRGDADPLRLIAAWFEDDRDSEAALNELRGTRPELSVVRSSTLDEPVDPVAAGHVLIARVPAAQVSWVSRLCFGGDR